MKALDDLCDLIINCEDDAEYERLKELYHQKILEIDKNEQQSSSNLRRACKRASKKTMDASGIGSDNQVSEATT
jgi:hypothetical protein